MLSPALHDRYLKDPMPIRLGGIAADLARIASSAGNPANQDAVAGLLEESKWFMEWAAPEAPLEVQAALAEMQIEVAHWQHRWVNGKPEPAMQRKAQEWSDRLLGLAGLV